MRTTLLALALVLSVPSTIQAQRTYAEDPLAFAGQTVTLNELTVAAGFSSLGFWVSLANDDPHLVTVIPDSVQGGPVEVGATVSVTGLVRPMTVQVLNAWLADGSISEQEWAVASFAQAFLEATAVTVTRPVSR